MSAWGLARVLSELSRREVESQADLTWPSEERPLRERVLAEVPHA